ncbi:hypothetical protein U2A4042170042 [Corynebacterium striatum]|nr:hypothetical protein U2A4042170042 [Corynebacterium striatum]
MSTIDKAVQVIYDAPPSAASYPKSMMTTGTAHGNTAPNTRPKNGKLMPNIYTLELMEASKGVLKDLYEIDCI